MHHFGIPPSKDWPSDVIDAVAQFHQGDLVANLPLFYWADPTNAIHARTKAYAGKYDDPLVVTFGTLAPYGIITTQTCDLGEQNPRPRTAWVQLAPVYNGEAPHPTDPNRPALDHNQCSAIAKRQTLNRYPLNLDDPGFWYADLTIEVPVERGWLARQTPTVVLHDDTARSDFADRLAWQRRRPAFSEPFVTTIQAPIVDALKRLAKTNKDTYDRMDQQVTEIGVTVNNRLIVAQAELTVLHEGLDQDLKDWWADLWTQTLGPATEGAGIDLLPLRIEHLASLSALDYRRMTHLPLREMSPNPAVYGIDPADLTAD